MILQESEEKEKEKEKEREKTMSSEEEGEEETFVSGRRMGSSSTASSPRSNFRELDTEFLTTQAKTWIEKVLGKRYDEEETVADLLADGEILFEISKLIGDLMEKKFGAKIYSPVSLEGTAFGKQNRKYVPYSHVDAFLKICKKLGLTGVDLFSPPDAVEKRDVRRVCLCLRALSKKARSKHLDMPDFDLVTHMPTEMFEGMQKYLEQIRYSMYGEEFNAVLGSEEGLEKNNEPFFTGPFDLLPKDHDIAESTGADIGSCSVSPRSESFTNDGHSFQGSLGGSPLRNSLVEGNASLTPANADDQKINEVPTSMNTIITDAVNMYLAKSDSFPRKNSLDEVHDPLTPINDEGKIVNENPKIIDTAIADTFDGHSPESTPVFFASITHHHDGDNSIQVPKPEIVDVDSAVSMTGAFNYAVEADTDFFVKTRNGLGADIVNDESINVRKAKTVDDDAVDIKMKDINSAVVAEKDTVLATFNGIEADKFDGDTKNVLKSDIFQDVKFDGLEADKFDGDAKDSVANKKRGDVNCAYVTEEDFCVKAARNNSSSVADVEYDSKSTSKIEAVIIESSENKKIEGGIQFILPNVPEEKIVNIDRSELPKGDDKDPDSFYITPDENCALITNESAIHLQTSTGSENDNDNADDSSKTDVTITEKDESERKLMAESKKKNKLWLSVSAGGVAVIGAALMYMQWCKRKSEECEIKEGDTLTDISKRVGKPDWKELIVINPDIRNPDLIYPGQRLKLD